MMGKPARRDSPLFITLDLDRVYSPKHPLRRIDDVLDLSFVRGAVAHTYGTRGNPSTDPETIVRMLLLLFLEKVPSERHLLMLMPGRLDWCLFCRIDPSGAVPDHSVLSKARRRWGLDVFHRIFDRVLAQCVEAGLVGGDVFHVDSTLVKANASLDGRMARVLWEQLERTAPGGDAPVGDPGDGRSDDDDAEGGGLSGVPAQDTQARELPPRSTGRVNAERVSVADPDCATVTRKNRGTMLAYRDHRIVDDLDGIIMATIATAGDMDDGRMLLPLLRRCEFRSGCRPETVVGDSMYGTVENLATLKEDGIEAIIKKRRGKDTPKKSWLEFLDPSIPVEKALDLMGRRRTVIEGRWADAHEHHGHRTARWRRRWRVQIQSELVATVQNLKKLAKAMRRRGDSAARALGSAMRAVMRVLDPVVNAIHHDGRAKWSLGER